MNISKRSGLSTDPCAPLWLPLILSENFLLIPNLSIFYRSTNSLSISVDSLRMLSLPSFPPVLWRRCQMLLQNPGKPIAVYHIDCPLPSALQLFMHSIAYTSSRDCKKTRKAQFLLGEPMMAIVPHDAFLRVLRRSMFGNSLHYLAHYARHTNRSIIPRFTSIFPFRRLVQS